MFASAYVILPFSDEPPGEAIRGSLARFENGLRGDVPDEWLVFEDETDFIRALHTTSYVFTSDNGSTRIQGGDPWRLDIRQVRAEMVRRGLDRWQVRFVDLEPDLDAFFDRFVDRLERHPITAGFGFWRNGLGRWDWWELGGRFDGWISGSPRRPGRRKPMLSSGDAPGRILLDRIVKTLENELGSEPPPFVDVRSDENTEIVSRLLEDARADRESGCPGALVLPPGSAEDRFRWIGTWPQVGPVDAVAAIGLAEGASWKDIVIAVYERFPEHWAACVSYHF